MFEQLKVLEIASVLAGPLVGTFFAELGARVTKIENKRTGGDVTRTWKLPSEPADAPSSAYYASANYGKSTLLLDFRDERDYKQVLDLATAADVVIANFKPGDAQKLGLDYPTLRALNSRMIYAELTGFGEYDPRPAFDVVLQAESGFMYMNGEKGGKPLKMPVAMIDILAAHQLKQGILCALMRRMQDDRGCRVHVSLFDAAVSSLANQATNWLMAGHIPQPIGSCHPNIAPYGDMYLTLDKKWLVLSVGNNRQFTQLCDALNIPELSRNPDFSTNRSRVTHREQLNDVIAREISRQNGTHWEQLFLSEQIPFGLIRDMQEVFTNPQSQKLILEEVTESTRTQRVKNAVFTLSDS